MPITSSFFATHLVNVYELVSTLDSMGSTVKTIGAELYALDCRAMEVSEWERLRYEQMNMVGIKKFHFDSDPAITNDHVILFDGNYYWVRGIKNEASMDKVWTVVGEQIPQSQL